MNKKLDDDQRNIILSFQKKIPVDVFGLCKALKVSHVKKHDGMPKDLSGIIIKKGDDYHIFCNGNEPLTRQRFTVAHELAHYLLHWKQLGDKYPENFLLRGGLSTADETEANVFAAEVLMPFLKINEYIEKWGGFSIEDMAKYFEVSSQAMTIRLGIPLDI